MLSPLYSLTTPTTLLPPRSMERPKVFLCPATKVFTIWFHCDTDGFGLKSVGVLQSTSGLITGPYAFVRECFRPDDADSYDQSTYYDDPAMPGGDGHMYHVRSVFNSYAGISRMNENCTDTTGIISGGTPKMEAQALFRDVHGVLHLVGSHETGWGPNAALFLTSPNASLVGAVWVNNYNPSGSGSTWDSQSTFMFPYRHPDGHVTHIWMADRWNYYDVGSIQNASYVWLPFNPPTGPVPPNPQSGWMVSLKPCDTTDPLQQFQYGGGGKDTVTHVGSGLCIAQPSPALSSQSGGIGVLTCDGTPSQQWYFVGDAFSNTTSGFGADCVNWNAGNGDELGAAIILYRCGNETQWNSRWDVPAAAGVPGTFEALSDATRTGFCLAVAPSPDPSLWGLPWRDAWQLKDF